MAGSTDRLGPLVVFVEAWTFLRQCIRGFLELEGTDRALTIAAQAFMAIVPLFILVSAATGSSGENVSDYLVDRFNLSGEAEDSVEQLFRNPAGVGSISLFSILLVIVSGVSFTRRLQRMYERAWEQTPSGVRGSLSATLGLGVLLVEIVLLYFIRTLIRGLPLDEVLLVPLSAVAGLILWTSIPWLLLDRRIPWRRLLPSGAIASVAVGFYGVATTIYMPDLIERYSSRYGLMGVTIALLGWLLCIGFVLVAAAVIGAELDHSDRPWARAVTSWVTDRTTRVREGQPRARRRRTTPP
jgi:uncharacterized BrkB/YihY/UPF0761 family membrane protein